MRHPIAGVPTQVDGRDVYRFVIPEGAVSLHFANYLPGQTDDEVEGGYQSTPEFAVEAGRIYTWEEEPPQNAQGVRTDLWLPLLARLYMTSNPILASAGEGGSISDAGSTAVKYGRSKTYTMTPDDGFVIADVLVNGRSVGAVSEYTFTKVRRAQVIEVIFAIDPDAVSESPAEDSADPMYGYEKIA